MKRKLGLALAILAGAGLLWWAPPARLRIWDHRRAQAFVRFAIWDPARYHRCFWARRSDYNDPVLGAALLADPLVVSHRIAELVAKDKDDGDEDTILLYRGEWALYYAGLRRQGLDLRAIAARPEGPSMLLGLLAAEARPPAWWRQDHWLAADGRPSPGYHLGLLDQAQAQQALRWIWATLPKSDLGLMTALIYALSAHPELMSYDQTTAVLTEWVRQNAQYFNPNHSLALEQALHVRQRLHDSLGPAPGLKFLVDPRLRPESETVIREFLSLAGCQPVSGSEELDLQQAVVSFREVTTARLTPVQHQVRELRPGGRYRASYTVERTVTTNTRESAGTAPEDVVSLVLGVKGESYALPPCNDPLKTDLQDPEKVDVLRPWRWGRSAYAFGWEPGN